MPRHMRLHALISRAAQSQERWSFATAGPPSIVANSAVRPRRCRASVRILLDLAQLSRHKAFRCGCYCSTAVHASVCIAWRPLVRARGRAVLASWSHMSKGQRCSRGVRGFLLPCLHRAYGQAPSRNDFLCARVDRTLCGSPQRLLHYLEAADRLPKGLTSQRH